MDRERMIYIACAGEGKRWDLSYPKFLAPFNGVPNIYRTVNMLQGKPFKVSVREEHKGLIGNLPHLIGSPTPEKARFTNFPLKERDVLLYGDVRYWAPDLEALLSAPPSTFLLRLGGNRRTRKSYGEVFGFVVSQEILDRIEALPPDGKAWGIVSSGQGKNGLYQPYPSFRLIIASDLTDDYDSVQEYERVRGVSETGLAHNQRQGGSTPPPATNSEFGAAAWGVKDVVSSG